MWVSNWFWSDRFVSFKKGYLSRCDAEDFTFMIFWMAWESLKNDEGFLAGFFNVLKYLAAWKVLGMVLMESTTAKHHKCLVTSGRSCCSYEEVHFFHQYHTNILLKIAVFQLSQLVCQIWSTDDTTPRHLHRWHLGMTGLLSLGVGFFTASLH